MAACVAVGAALALQTASAQPDSARQTVKTVQYTTRAGDTLYDVADRYLQGPDDWTLVAQLNGVPAPKQLQPGTVLNLPAARLRKERLSARVVAAQGPVERAASGAVGFVPVAVDATLTEGDRLRTGANGFVTLELADGTHLSLPPDSQIDLSTLRRTVLTGTLERVIDLQRGSVDSDVTHLKKKDDRFQIRSPSVVAGVRGTRFRVNYDTDGKAATRVEVLDGTVGVAPGAQPARDAALVHANFGNVSAADGQVGAPIALLDAPRLVDPAKVQDEAQVGFTLEPLDGAQAYHVQIARDAGLLDLFREARSNAPRVSFDDVPDGTYFVRVSAVDANGLEGQPRTYAFERRQFGLATSAGPGAGGYEFRWTTSGAAGAAGAAGATHFRFVLSASKDLGNPIVDQLEVGGGRIAVAKLPPGDYYWTVIAEQFSGGRFYEKASPVNAFTLAR
jgi:hypothetical protein